jgi:hypothetical protein
VNRPAGLKALFAAEAEGCAQVVNAAGTVLD